MRTFDHRELFAFLGFALTLALALSAAYAETNLPQDCTSRRPTSGAWFTGPMIANTAATAPRGHALLETYLYDDTVQGAFGLHGGHQGAAHENDYGSLTYIVYALTDKTAAGLIPTGGYNQVSGGASSPGVQMGDWTLMAQRRLTGFEPCRELPTISAALQETLPTGRYDKLGDRPDGGLGAGAYTTNLALYTQTWFWLPNQRIVRLRVNVSNAISSTVKLQDASVYGTSQGFRGTARPGNSLFVDIAGEYSLARRWVLAADGLYRDSGNTRVSGYDVQGVSGSQGTANIVINSGGSDSWGVAPAIEYSWKPWIGVLVGARYIFAGRNTSETITPAIAINIVH